MCKNVLVDVPFDEIVALFKIQKPGFHLIFDKVAAPREYFIKLSNELQEQLPHYKDSFYAFVKRVSDHSLVLT
uniref:DUF4939 domain-containing protein n=1 Tax=Panagrellus redivivus TaxID=6233 RepID=A0A7E4WC03_PANRE